MDRADRAEAIARRAAELAELADSLARRARDAEDVDEELAQLEAELAALDEERAKLDLDLDDLVEPPAPEEPEAERDDGESIVIRLGNLGERVAALVGAAINLAGGTGGFGAFRDEVEHDLDVRGPVPLTVHSFAGSVHVLAGTDDRVHVQATRHAMTQAALDDITVAVAEHDSGVEVSTSHRDGWARRAWVRLTITVPPSTPVRIRTQAGSIEVTGTGAEVQAHTNAGSITVRGSDGAAELETSGGSIRVSDHSGPVTAHTMGGSIRLAGDLGPAVEAETIGGSITIEGLDGSVAASTKGGSVRVEGRFAGTCSVDTAGGSITIGVAEGTRVSVDGAGTGVSTDVEGLVAQGSAIRGEIGGGGDGRLVVRTVAGALRINRVR